MKAIQPTNFHGVVLAGLAIGAVGAGVSAYGTAQNASATADAAQYNALLEKNFAKKQQAKVDALVAGKEEKLEGINTILDRFQGGGAFGSSDVLANIREAQSEFASLGAGDFSGFQDQLDQILKGTLANTYGSGSPSGTFTQLAADTIMNLRQGGLQTALQTGEYLSRESQQLLGTEFGIMDQSFEQQYMIERNKVSAITGAQMIQAQQTGIGTQALGGAIGQIGGAISSYGAYKQNMNMAQKQQTAAENFQTSSLALQDRALTLQQSYFNSPKFTSPYNVGAPTGGGGGGGIYPPLPTGGGIGAPVGNVRLPGAGNFYSLTGAPYSTMDDYFDAVGTFNAGVLPGPDVYPYGVQ
jgi:hypothetical protein